MSTIVFFVFAILAIAAAWGVVTSKNIVHSAFYLALSFAGVAVLYILMNADFLAAVQLLIYTGAVAVMVVFAVMLTLRGDVRESSPENRRWMVGALVAVSVFAMIALVVLTNADWRVLPTPWTGGGSAEDMSLLLLSQFMIPFEASAVLLTVALIGAVILAKGVKESK
ncbi:NADH-quinone oxidoreductase subunit J family protein [Desulfosporosinus youngiae]|uniref:NADH-quinone oxidoreductase subunit J n=1 Tax=Desulfosporosinus youngiae DSM 17734 TaxID=768710 RepID=H5XYC5_9FIRM|nr:NADH-quinone oxidoreductase subunit J [Desulfosporosinus youngiae]EHQ91221.1 NADH:ubiquinone oxidoreductase subunit 6 (chain J) [Desulfosporosinus youngiae DSM 17734]EHQ91404.1 NADH:ubiquinone oxidoreductase subunit 6 (chain J) [Desulfosporosinus youngiae DSM 17734]